MSTIKRLFKPMKWIALVVVAGVALIVADAWTALGKRATGERRARMERSPNYKDGHFVNPQPLVNDAIGSLTGWFHRSAYISPESALLPERVDPKRIATPP